MALKINTCSLILMSFSTKSFVFSLKSMPFSKENLLIMITKYWGGCSRMVLSMCFVSLVHTHQFFVKSTLSDSLINLDIVKFIFGMILNSLILDTRIRFAYRANIPYSRNGRKKQISEMT